jgi:hypothetical protein
MDYKSKDQLEKIFTDIYKNDKWSMGQNDSKSGLGSSMEYTESIMKSLIQVVKNNNIRSLIDTSCGDWYWMKTIRKQLKCKYVGIDIVNDIVQSNTVQYSDDNTIFIHGDFLNILKTATDKSIDLILCRHTCEHLPTEYILEFIKEAKRTSKYLLLTTKTTDAVSPVNTDVVLTTTPYRPINLHLPPYSLVLDEYLIEKIYDGPSTKHDPEMFINLYKFN